MSGDAMFGKAMFGKAMLGKAESGDACSSQAASSGATGDGGLSDLCRPGAGNLSEAEAALVCFAAWPDGLLMADEEYRVCYVSAKATDILGWRAEEAQGRHLHELLCPHTRDGAHTLEDCPLCPADVDPNEVGSGFWLGRSGVNVSVDYRIVPLGHVPSNDHTVSPAQVVRPDRGSTGGWMLSFFDNRARSHSHREMVKLTQYVDQSPAPIAEFDAEGQLLFGNPALQEQLLLHGFDENGAARIWPAHLATICQRAWRDQMVINDVEVRVDDNWYRWHFHPVAGADQDSVLAYLFDVTEQKAAEIQLAQEKAAARRDFFAKMVHELRTPLNAIIGFSQVLARRLDGVLTERDKASLRAIRAAGLQLNELVSDTLDIAKIEAGKMIVEEDHFGIAQVLESFHDQVTTLAEAKQLQYRCDCEPSLMIRSDFKKVRQILLNLVANAIKYTQHGSVQVRAFMQGSHSLVLEVQDTGIGIPDGQRDKLFRSYEQVSDERNKGIQGTGLGLALVAELVQMLAGAIEVESVVGEGSLFRVTLPVSA